MIVQEKKLLICLFLIIAGFCCGIYSREMLEVAADGSQKYIMVKNLSNGEYSRRPVKQLTSHEATYTLLENVQLAVPLLIPENITVTLDLNGCVLKGSGNNFTIINKGTLTLKDSKPQTKHKYTKGVDGRYVWDDAGGNIIVNGGAITNGPIVYGEGEERPEISTAGEVIKWKDCSGVENRGTITMESGNIVGNSSEYRGGGVSNSGTFNLNGGSIVGNAAHTGGGVENYDDFIMNGGIIADNTAFMSGGIENDGRFTMKDGSIEYNTAERCGGVGCGEDSVITIEGGSIKGNTATINGGGLGISNRFVMKGGSIVENKAGETGGGLWIGCFEPSLEGGIISDNTAEYGGGIELAWGELSIKDCIIANNKASNGSAVELAPNARIFIESGGFEGDFAVGNQTQAAAKSDDLPIRISGGYFNSEPDSTLIEAGKSCVSNPNDDPNYPADTFPHKIQ